MGCLAGGAGLKCATGYVLRARLAFMWDEVWVQVGAGGFESRTRRRRVYELRGRNLWVRRFINTNQY